MGVEKGSRGRWGQADAGLKRAADVAIAEVLRVKEGERVLIVTNPAPDVHAVSLALYDAALDALARPVLVVQPERSQLDFADESVVAAIASQPDVFISMSQEKLGKDRRAVADPIVDAQGASYDSVFHYLLHGKKALRAFWSPHVTREMFERTVPIDYATLQRECARLSRILDDAIGIDISAKGGTRLTVALRGRRAMSDDGSFSAPGAGGNLPAGEVFISPEIGASSGVIVYDASMTVHDGDIVVSEPISVDVRGGFVAEIRGGVEAERLRETIALGEERARELEREGLLPGGLGEIYRRNARNLGELGIGLNPRAGITGNMLEDEKARGTCHVAIGSNYDNDAPALIHLDGLIRSPTITVFMEGGRRVAIMKDGALAL